MFVFLTSPIGLTKASRTVEQDDGKAVAAFQLVQDADHGVLGAVHLGQAVNAFPS